MGALQCQCNQSITLCKGGVALVKNKIKVLRAERDWTQADLAERVGISRQAVISIEKYKYTPSLELAFQIAKTFSVDLTTVFNLEEESE